MLQKFPHRKFPEPNSVNKISEISSTIGDWEQRSIRLRKNERWKSSKASTSGINFEKKIILIRK